MLGINEDIAAAALADLAVRIWIKMPLPSKVAATMVGSCNRKFEELGKPMVASAQRVGVRHFVEVRPTDPAYLVLGPAAFRRAVHEVIGD